MNAFRFTELFRDTVRMHGIADAARIYRRQRIPLWEVLVWVRTVPELRLSFGAQA